MVCGELLTSNPASLVARLQSAFGGAVPAGSWFATLASAGAGGYGAVALGGLTRFGSVVVGIVKGLLDGKNSTTTTHHEL